MEPNSDHLLTGADCFSRTPYERGVFAHYRNRDEPLADELVIFCDSSQGFKSCLAEFQRGLEAGRQRAEKYQEMAKKQDEVWLEWLDPLKHL